jgi:hypothetical protein
VNGVTLKVLFLPSDTIGYTLFSSMPGNIAGNHFPKVLLALLSHCFEYLSRQFVASGKQCDTKTNQASTVDVKTLVPVLGQK